MEWMDRAGQLYNQMNSAGARQAEAAERFLEDASAGAPFAGGEMNFCRILSLKRIDDDDKRFASKITGFYTIASKLRTSLVLLWQYHDDGSLTCDVGVEARIARELSRAFADQVRGVTFTPAAMPQVDPGNELWGIDGLCVSQSGEMPPSIDDTLRELRPGCALMLVLNPIEQGEVKAAIERADRHASFLSMLHKLSLTLGTTRVQSRASGTSNAEAATQIRTSMTSRNTSDTHTRQSGSAQGSNTGVHMGISLGGNNSTNQGASVSHATGDSSGVTDGSTTGRTRTSTVTETDGKNDAENVNVSAAFSRLGAAISQLTRRRKRLHQAQTSGMSRCAVYAFAPQQRAQIILATINAQDAACSRGEADMDQITRIRRAGNAGDMLRLLRTGAHIPGFGTAALPGEIIPFLPMQEMSGFAVDRSAAFARNVVLHPGADTIRIGVIIDEERRTTRIVELDIDEFTSHIIAAGTTGCGKTTALCNLINGTMRKREGVHVLAIDPKNSIRPTDFVGGATLYTTRTDGNVNTLRLQPFAVPDGVSLASHIDHLEALFESCWSMSAAMPDILKQAVYAVYRCCGWDVANGVRLEIPGVPQWPDFGMLEEQTRRIICEGGFSERTRSDYLGALCTRLHTLSTDVYAKIFQAERTIPFEKLFDRNVIIHCGSVTGETLSLIMSVLLLQLVEYRQSVADGRRNRPLQHMTLFEEAHALAPRETSAGGGREDVSIGNKTGEAIVKLLAEARDVGESCILSNQTIHELSRQAVENTATKLVFQTQGRGDIEDLSAAMALEPSSAGGVSQSLGLVRLEKYQAVIYQRSWSSTPVKTLLDDNPLANVAWSRPGSSEDLRAWRGRVIEVLCRAGTIEETCRQMQTLLQDERIAEQIREDTCTLLDERLNAPEEAWEEKAGALLLSCFGNMVSVLLPHFRDDPDGLFAAVLANLGKYADVGALTLNERKRLALEILRAERARGTQGL